MSDTYNHLAAQYASIRKVQYEKEHARIIAQRDRLANVVKQLLEHGQWFIGAIESREPFGVDFEKLGVEAQAAIDEIEKGGS